MSGDRAVSSLDTALQLIDAVKRWDRRDVSHALAQADLPALAVVLAAMVDDAKPVSELIGWTDNQDDIHDGWHWSDLLRAHATYEQYRYRGIAPDEIPADVREGQRVYDRVKARRRRAARVAA